MNNPKLISLLFLILFGISFAQNESAGITFSDFLKSQALTPDTSGAEIPVAKEELAVVYLSPVALYASYEVFLDSIETYANAILPEKERLDSMKAAVNSETAGPKDEFEKQVDYEKRLADFEKARRQKILTLEREYGERIKGAMEKLRAGIAFKEDIQPGWGGTLKKDAGVEEYRERIDGFTAKISAMKARISRITGLFGKLEFSREDTKALSGHWQQKNILYISRLEKACELMQDYIIQEQVKILSTERSRFPMNLGAYDADKETFEFNMNDVASQTVPFDYSGVIKISPEQARETNRQTDNFAASIDYINYPFVIDDAKLYPGVKKAHVYYRGQELPTRGVFKNVSGLDNLQGYSEWATYASSLLSGKITPRNLDSLYAMTPNICTDCNSDGDSKKTFWSGKNVFRAAMLGLSALSLGLLFLVL
ncbi:MAG: hypothetical protein LBQ87_09425 [Candidatus Fibromonas sp.]|jgi:hypothetical protein|nr:hypothetical protein [Candidatus Fibromonas sp.]